MDQDLNPRRGGGVKNMQRYGVSNQLGNSVLFGVSVVSGVFMCLTRHLRLKR